MTPPAALIGTLNHLLWCDRMWLGRFVDEPCTVPSFGAAMFAGWAELAREREVTDLPWLPGVVRILETPTG